MQDGLQKPAWASVDTSYVASLDILSGCHFICEKVIAHHTPTIHSDLKVQETTDPDHVRHLPTCPDFAYYHPQDTMMPQQCCSKPLAKVGWLEEHSKLQELQAHTGCTSMIAAAPWAEQKKTRCSFAARLTNCVKHRIERLLSATERLVKGHAHNT